MNIHSAYSLLESQPASPVQNEQKKQKMSQEEKNSGDTLSISDEAKEMLAKMTKSLVMGHSADSKGMGSGTDSQGQASSGGEGQPGSGEGKGAGGAGGASGGNAQSSESQIEKLQAQIKQLQAQYQSVMQGTTPEGVKEAQGGALQQKIVALEQQVRELQTAASKA